MMSRTRRFRSVVRGIFAAGEIRCSAKTMSRIFSAGIYPDSVVVGLVVAKRRRKNVRRHSRSASRYVCGTRVDAGAVIRLITLSFSGGTERKETRENLASDAAAGGDLFAVGLVTPPALVTARRGLLRRSGAANAAGRPQALLQLQQLAHEVQVRADDRARILHQLVRLHHRQALVPHYVGDGDRRATRHAGLTMHQHAAAGLPRFL